VVVSIVFAHFWGVLQLIILGSFARTVRVRTALTALAAGLYASAPLTVLVEFVWTRLLALITGAPVGDVVQMASYTADPFVEELVKVLPLVALLLAVRVVRRQWSITDCVIVGAALGSGFGLAEDLYRYSAAAANAGSIHGGWLLRPDFGTIVTVPSPWTTVTSWLPSGAVPRGLFSFASRTPSALNLHAAWSAIAGLGAGLFVLDRRLIARRVGFILLLYVGLDHALSNAALSASSWRIVVVSSSTLQELLPGLPLAALAIAWWLDRRRQTKVILPELALAAEKAISPPVLGTVRTALTRAPWSVARVDTLVRLRRSYALSGSESDAGDGLRRLIVDLRDRIDREVPQSGPLAMRVSRWTWARLLAKLRQPKVLAWLVMITPSVLWFVVGGFPMTAWLQGALAGPPAWTMIRLLSGAALAWLAWNAIVGVRLWPQAAVSPLADFPATFSLGLLAALGAVALGGYIFVISVTSGPGAHVITNIHVLEASGNLDVSDGLLIAIAGGLVALALISGIGELLAAGALVEESIAAGSLETITEVALTNPALVAEMTAGEGIVAVIDAAAIADDLLAATTAASNGGRFIQAVTTLSGMVGMIASQKADIIIQLMEQLGFGWRGVTDAGGYIEMVSEDGRFIFRIMTDTGTIMYGKFDPNTLDFIWKSL
jgi:hypothetical protein